MTHDPRSGGERVVLVDRDDAEIGSEEKLRAHARGVLHRAFSVFVLNAAGEVLLQRRAEEKYHTGGLWSNTCCGHPRPGEEIGAAAERRLFEEMGFRCRLTRRFGFVYQAELGGGLAEHEYDHVFLGWHEGDPAPDPAEVAGWRRVPLERLLREVEASPGAFTPWFRTALEGLLRDPLLRAG
jgi:isopentenyl-diphosphate Delta-isomerase